MNRKITASIIVVHLSSLSLSHCKYLKAVLPLAQVERHPAHHVEALPRSTMIAGTMLMVHAQTLVAQERVLRVRFLYEMREERHLKQKRKLRKICVKYPIV